MKNGIVRSPLFYVGDKYKLIAEIKTYIPTNVGRLIEPFVGGGSVFLNVDADEYLLNDIDTNVINIHEMLCGYTSSPERFFRDFFSIIRHYNLSNTYLKKYVPDDLKKAFPKTHIAKYNKEAYSLMKADYNNQEEKDALLLYCLLIYGFNRMLRFNKKGEFNLPVGDVDFNQNTYNALEDYFRLLQKKQVKWRNDDFRQFLTTIDFRADDLVYLDPPYLITFSEYNKLWNEDTEKELLRLLDNMNNQGVRFAISNVTHYKGKTNSIFLEWASKYYSHPIKSNYISFNDNSIKNFNEVLITNY